jgi:hypothetical protein
MGLRPGTIRPIITTARNPLVSPLPRIFHASAFSRAVARTGVFCWGRRALSALFRASREFLDAPSGRMSIESGRKRLRTWLDWSLLPMGLAHCRVASKRRHQSLVARSIRESSLRNVLRRLIERMLECDLFNSDLRISRCRFDLYTEARNFCRGVSLSG